MFEISENEKTGNAKIRVLGVGGGGCNAVNTMIRSGLENIEYIVANTDSQALNASLAPTKVQLGADITKGLGAGANPEVARKAALDAHEKLSEIIDGSDMIFITAGMGGGTGTGAAPIVAKLAKEMGILTVGVVTKPFMFEGKKRMRQAMKGIADLQSCVDSLITIPNQKLLQLAGEELSLVETFKKADEVLLNAVQGISDLIHNTGLINADFADVSTIMANKGIALMGTGTCSGPERAIKAANEAISSPLLEDITIDGSTGIIVNITGGKSLTTHEANEAMTLIIEAADEDAEIIFGTVIDESLNDSIKITVIATGLQRGQDEDDLFIPSESPSVFTNDSTDHDSEEPMEFASDAKDSFEHDNSEDQTFEEIEHHVASAIDESPVESEPVTESSSFNNNSTLEKNDPINNRAKSIAERLGFMNFREDELDTPSYLRKDQ